MTRSRAVSAAALAVAATLALGGCGSTPAANPAATPGSGATSSLAAPDTGTPAPSDASGVATGLVSPVQGIVLHVDTPSLGKVTAFRLLTADGRQVDFVVGTLEDAADFPAAHLPEHVATSEPVRVYFRTEGSSLVVYRLEDAAPASPSAS